MGLGLYISMQLVKSYGGSIDFISEPLNGSTFIFTFNLKIDNEVYQDKKSKEEYFKEMCEIYAQ